MQEPTFNNKKSRCNQALANRQQGAALIMLMLVLALAVTVFTVNHSDPETKRLRLEQHTQQALSKAKQALIAYAALTYERSAFQDTPLNSGRILRLPCPDLGIAVTPEGEQEPSCGAAYASAIGRFPWATLGIEALKDGFGECLWYAVSGHYKTQPGGLPISARMVNWDSPGQIALYESNGIDLITPDNPDGRLVAAIFSPGPALSGQIRNETSGTQCGGNYNSANFLESINFANNAVFDNVNFTIDEIAQGAIRSNIINDIIITVSKEEIWNEIQNRSFPDLDPNAAAPPDPRPVPLSSNVIFLDLIRELALCLQSYGLSHGGGDLRLPWAAPVGLANPNNWFYANETHYVEQANRFGGRFPFLIPVTSAIFSGGSDIFNAGSCFEFDASISQPPDSVNPLYRNLWNDWKDNIFYAVSAAFAPNAVVPPPAPGAPKSCVSPNPPVTTQARRGYLSVNCNGNYAAVVLFAGSPLNGQVRGGPPEPIDQRANLANYLEGGNVAALNDPLGEGDFISGAVNVNDALICIDINLNVIDC